jgi:acyl-CoA synthetase (AMP-forming)/AMP-acid ligase II
MSVAPAERSLLIGSLIGERARQADRVFLSDREGRTVSFGELEAIRAELAVALDTLGVPAGAAVVVQPTDLLEYAAGLIALVGTGRVAVPVDPRAPREELRRIAGIASPAASLSAGLSLEENAPVEPRVFPGGGIFLCTSGTTGSPKGVFLSEAQLEHVARQVASHHEIGPDDRGLCLLPLFHVNAEVVSLLSSLIGGAELVLEERFHRTGFWELVAERQVTWINAAPAIIAILASTDPPAAKPPSVRFVRSASAPLAAATLRRFEEIAGIPVLESYGMTEAASMITANPIGAGRPGSVGQPVGTEVRIQAGGHPAGTGEVGRVQIRGRGVITSYAVGGEEETFFEDGWLDTKDLGYFDEDGYLFLVGRADDVINRGGEKVYPREVEEVLLASGELAAAVVVGEPHPILGSSPVAYVVAAEKPASEDELVERLARRCAGELSSYKWPRAIHLVESLPVGPTGKVRRREVTPALLQAGA